MGPTQTMPRNLQPCLTNDCFGSQCCARHRLSAGKTLYAKQPQDFFEVSTDSESVDMSRYIIQVVLTEIFWT